MAVVRTILPRKGLIQPQHGLTGYEADQDYNWQLLDGNAAFVSDLLPADLNMNGVVSGFVLSVAPSLSPGLTAGVLYAQGRRFAPATAPTPGSAPPGVQSFLFYNSSAGFYYTVNTSPANAGDALVGAVTAGASAVTSVAQATRIGGSIGLAPVSGGNFTVAHLLGRVPFSTTLLMTSAGSIWFQSTLYDATNVYLVASGGGVTGRVILW